MDPSPLGLAPPAPNAPGGYLLADLDALLDEVGGSYPLLGYAVMPDEPYDEATALDPVILAALVRP
jgi:hypothetical protein